MTTLSALHISKICRISERKIQYHTAQPGFIKCHITFFFNSHLRMCLLILERERKGERERDINQLPPICAPTGDRTCNLSTCPDQGYNPQPLVCGLTLQPTEPPGQGCHITLKSHTVSDSTRRQYVHIVKISKSPKLHIQMTAFRSVAVII